MWQPTGRTLIAAALAAALFGIAAPLAAQTPEDSLRAQLRALQRRLDSLAAVIATMRAGEPADTLDPLARIRAAAEAAAAAADTAPPPAAEAERFVGRQGNLNALNPEISVTGDVLALTSTDAERRDNFVAREFEFAFQSNLDPFSRAKVFLGRHEPGGELEPFGEHEEDEEEHGGEFEIEEGYVEWLGLPAGLGLKLGRFRQRFGKLNRWHSHALPGQQYPLPYLVFFGEEGLAQTGASVHWLAPVRGFGTWEVWGEVTRSANEALFGESSGLSALAHINAFWDLSAATYLELGVSALTGDREVGTDDDSRMIGADFTLDWRPPAAAKYRQLTLHGSWMLHRRRLGDGGRLDAHGGFAHAEFRFAEQWILGARYEYAEQPDDPARRAWLFAPTLTWWQSEYVRVRAEYDLLDRPGAGRFGQFLIQTTIAMGPHKHETY